MKAMVVDKFGPPEVMQLREIERPVPKPDEVLIKSMFSSVNTLDIVFRSGMKTMFGLIRLVTGVRRPKRRILGSDIAGEVIAVGDACERINPGDRIYGGARSGANAEFATTPENKVVLLPQSVSFQAAGVTPVAGISALQGLRDVGNIASNKKVLIYGASGGIGTFALQLAKYYEAEITGVASEKNRDLVLKLGAHQFIDYKTQDFTNLDGKYDLIFDAVGKLPLGLWKKALSEDGVFVNVGSPSMPFVRFLAISSSNKFRKQKAYTFNATYNQDDLSFIAELIANGSIKPVVDRTYGLEKLPEAHKYYEQGHSKGKVAIQITKE